MAVAAREARRREGGISLVETTIALLILAVGLLAMLAVQVTALQQGKWGRHTSEAAVVARERVELIRRLPFTDPLVQPTAWTAPLAVNKTVQATGAPAGGFIEQQFTVQWRITAAVFDPNLRTVDVRVTWTENDRQGAVSQRRYAMSTSIYNN